MNLRKCLIALTIIAVFLYAGIQVSVVLQSAMIPQKLAMRVESESLDGPGAGTNGDGGDPVPGPGIPK